MGSGIAQVLAQASFDVVLIDLKQEFVDNGLAKIEKRIASSVKRKKLTLNDKDRIMGAIKGSTDQSDASDAALVIEAVVEDKDMKGELFRTLDKVCAAETIFTTNTSTLSVTELGALSGRPSRFLGLHFFNPVPAMRLVEIIPGLNTPKEVVDGVNGMVQAINKTPIVVQDCPGFLVNRILLSYINEALLCAQEGISPELIDTEAKEAGFPMGPFELSDMVGWDISLHTFTVLHGSYGERFPFPPLVQKLNDAGRLGLKSGGGVYTDGKVTDEFHTMVKEIGPPIKRNDFSINRLILRLVNEAIYCLQEGIASPEDIDRAMVLGTGFPNKAGIGGPLNWADEKGLDWVLSNLEELSGKVSAVRFWPHYLLKTYIGAGRLGRKVKSGFLAYSS
jgi:3-hydroxyacyl-CoA dehydrogenase